MSFSYGSRLAPQQDRSWAEQIKEANIQDLDLPPVADICYHAIITKTKTAKDESKQQMTLTKKIPGTLGLEEARCSSYLEYRLSPKTASDTDIWPDDQERSYHKWMRLILPMGKMKVWAKVREEKQVEKDGKKFMEIGDWKDKLSGRNELIKTMIEEETGAIKLRKQISSHIQVIGGKLCRPLDRIFTDADGKPCQEELSYIYKSWEKLRWDKGFNRVMPVDGTKLTGDPRYLPFCVQSNVEQPMDFYQQDGIIQSPRNSEFRIEEMGFGLHAGIAMQGTIHRRLVHSYTSAIKMGPCKEKNLNELLYLKELYPEFSDTEFNNEQVILCEATMALRPELTTPGFGVEAAMQANFFCNKPVRKWVVRTHGYTDWGCKVCSELNEAVPSHSGSSSAVDLQLHASPTFWRDLLARCAKVALRPVKRKRSQMDQEDEMPESRMSGARVTSNSRTGSGSAIKQAAAVLQSASFVQEIYATTAEAEERNEVIGQASSPSPHIRVALLLWRLRAEIEGKPGVWSWRRLLKHEHPTNTHLSRSQRLALQVNQATENELRSENYAWKPGADTPGELSKPQLKRKWSKTQEKPVSKRLAVDRVSKLDTGNIDPFSSDLTFVLGSDCDSLDGVDLQYNMKPPTLRSNVQGDVDVHKALPELDRLYKSGYGSNAPRNYSQAYDPTQAKTNLFGDTIPSEACVNRSQPEVNFRNVSNVASYSSLTLDGLPSTYEADEDLAFHFFEYSSHSIKSNTDKQTQESFLSPMFGSNLSQLVPASRPIETKADQNTTLHQPQPRHSLAVQLAATEDEVNLGYNGSHSLSTEEYPDDLDKSADVQTHVDIDSSLQQEPPHNRETTVFADDQNLISSISYMHGPVYGSLETLLKPSQQQDSNTKVNAPYSQGINDVQDSTYMPVESVCFKDTGPSITQDVGTDNVDSRLGHWTPSPHANDFDQDASCESALSTTQEAQVGDISACPTRGYNNQQSYPALDGTRKTRPTGIACSAEDSWHSNLPPYISEVTEVGSSSFENASTARSSQQSVEQPEPFETLPSSVPDQNEHAITRLVPEGEENEVLGLSADELWVIHDTVGCNPCVDEIFGRGIPRAAKESPGKGMILGEIEGDDFESEGEPLSGKICEC